MLKKRHSIKSKVLIMSILVLVISNVTLGLFSYGAAKRQLNRKGEVILENAVKAAMEMIRLAQQGVEGGSFTLEKAQDMIKKDLIGGVQADGTRSIDSLLDLGENGYFFILNQEGEVLGHPVLEGENAWDLQDKSKKETLFIQDSIGKAIGGGGFTYYDWFLPNSDTAGRKIVCNQLDPEWGWIVTAGSYEIDFNQGAMDVLKYTIIGIIFFIVGVTIVMYRFSNRLGKALGEVTTRAHRIASLDITEDFLGNLSKSKDEIGELTNSFQQIIQNFRSFIRQISDASEYLASSSKDLTISSEQSAITMDEVAQAIGEIAEGANHQAEDTEKGAIYINDLGVLVEQNEDYVRKLNQSTIEVDKLQYEGLKIVEELVAKTEASNQATGDIQNVIYSTNESASKIETASNMIKSLAEQTNLLALNAAIEAARAGEAGRGFAVVAEEIRKLAEQSNHFTEDIAAIVADLSEKTQQAVITMEEVTNITKSQSESVVETNHKFMGISQAIESMNQVIRLINQSGEEMMEKKDTIVDIISTLSALSEENAAGTEEAAASIEEQTATMAEIAHSSERLTKLAHDMEESISKIKY